MKIVLCVAILLIFAEAEISAEWSAPEISMAHRSSLRTLTEKDAYHNILNLLKRHEKENIKVVNFNPLATKTSKVPLTNEIKYPQGYFLRFSSRSFIDDADVDIDILDGHHTSRVSLKKYPRSLYGNLMLEDGEGPGQYATHDFGYDKPSKGNHIFEEGKGPAQYATYDNGYDKPNKGNHIFEEGKGPAQYATHDNGYDKPSKGNHIFEEGKGPAQYATYDNGYDKPSKGNHIFEEGKGPAQYATHDNGYDKPSKGNHIFEEGKGPAQYATHDNGDNRPSKGVQVEKVVILELPTDNDFELLSKYNQEQKSAELKKRLQRLWKKEYQSKYLPYYDILNDSRHKKKKKLALHGRYRNYL